MGLGHALLHARHKRIIGDDLVAHLSFWGVCVWGESNTVLNSGKTLGPTHLVAHLQGRGTSGEIDSIISLNNVKQNYTNSLLLLPR